MRTPTTCCAHLVLAAHLALVAGEPKCGDHYWPETRPPRALDGTRATAGKFPFLVRLDIVYNASDARGQEYQHRFMRNGVIVGESHVLTIQPDFTRASCGPKLPNFRIITIQVSLVGAVQWPGLRYDAKSWHNHPKYNCTRNDLGIVQVHGKFKFKVNERGGINRVCMPAERVDYGDRDLPVYFVSFGWVDRATPSKLVRYMSTRFVSTETCRSRLAKTADISDDTVCLGTQGDIATRDKRICRADEGGALVSLERQRWVLVGIMSRTISGKLCDTKLIAFTKVASHTKWLREHIPDLKTLNSMG